MNTRLIVDLLIVGVLGYLGIAFAMFVLQRNFLYHPDKTPPSRERAQLDDMAEVRLTTADGLALLSWYKAAQDGQPTVLYTHGNAGSIEGRGDKVRPYLEQGYGLLLVGYRGFGSNPGSPSEDGLYDDARSALAYLNEQGVGASNIVLYGESLGTAVAVQMAVEMNAADNPAMAVVLEAPFTSIVAVAQGIYPWLPVNLLLRDRYDSLSKIKGIGAPLNIIHGEQDSVVPFRLGQALFEAGRGPKEGVWLPFADHHNVYDHEAAHAVLTFLNLYSAKRTKPIP